MYVYLLNFGDRALIIEIYGMNHIGVDVYRKIILKIAVTMPPKKFVGTIRRFAKPPTDVTYFVLK